jgi:SWI/SNF related-matrix-associated actin-dependent regulator of chromatin subfamily C
MMIGLRSTRQTSKPVVINLKKTEVGYKLTEENTIVTLGKAGNMFYRTESKATNADDAAIRSVEKDLMPKPPLQTLSGTPTPIPPQNYQPAPLRRVPSAKLMQTGPKMTGTSMMHHREKSPNSRTDPEKPKGREILPFSGFGNDLTPPSLKISDKMVDPVSQNHDQDFKDSMPMEGDKGGSTLQGQSAQDQDVHTFKTADKITKKYPIIIPSCAHWFSMDEIHQMEKDTLPEFFMGKPSKTPEIYKKYRNFIINLYRQNPRTYLNSTTCRRNLAGDVCAIMRIHSFLEHWGLINFSVDPATYDHNLFMTKPSLYNDKLLRFTKDDKLDTFDLEKKSLHHKLGENDMLLNQIKFLSKSVRPLCDFCGMICGLIWFQQKTLSQYQVSGAANGQPSPISQSKLSQPKGSELILCIKCYTEGNMPNILSPNDFQRVDLLTRLNSNISKNQVQSTWNQEETLRLLELIGKHQDNWHEVEKHFPNKTREEIILHYMQLPIKNITSINIAETNEDKIDDRTPLEKLADTNLSVFSDYSNPLLQHVAIFKSLLDKYKEKKGISAHDLKAQNNAMEIENQSGARPDSTTKAEVKSEDNNNQHEAMIEEKKEEEGSEVKNLYDTNKKLLTEFKDKVDKLNSVTEKEGELLVQLESETKDRAEFLKKREEDKIKELANLLIDIQLNKLEAKLTYLEEYEKILWQERKQMELLQRMQIAERVSLGFKRLELQRQGIQAGGNQIPSTKDDKGLGQASYDNVDDMLNFGIGMKNEEDMIKTDAL